MCLLLPGGALAVAETSQRREARLLGGAPGRPPDTAGCGSLGASIRSSPGTPAPSASLVTS